MQNLSRTIRLLLVSLCAAIFAHAQAGPDTITFTNGDKLVGHFVRSTASSVTFKSDMLGDLTIDWKKVKELQTSAKVAVLRKGVRLRRNANTSNVPQGTLAERDNTLRITPAPGVAPQSIPVADSAVVIDQSAFQKAMTHTPGFLADWTGTATFGATLVQATQDNRTFNGAVALVRAQPIEDWLNPSYRTLINFSTSYGELTQPATPTIKTSIYHAAAEQDQYFTPSVFAFGQADFDHNYSQGLELQQTYDGGVGWTALKSAAQELDLKGSMSYIHQQFEIGPGMSLVGSVFAEHYNRKLPHGAVVDQKLSVTPAWNNTNAYSAAFSTVLTMPVYKQLSGSTGVIDTFLNDPPPGFKKNSFQFTVGLTYSLK
ncbi:MAG TPA: DUF481 domain-containing protein [Bryobacteraceae bacterium]|nr:DUF481 domain-containing protein [Bryobacteraceae bacterium]